MAIIWQKSVEGTDYQVRSAGNTRRLYTDGVFHSQYNPRRPVTGSVWDLLLLPAFFHSLGHIQRVLVLGVGGGAVVNKLNHFLSPTCIDAVELNPVHIHVAKTFFHVSSNNVTLHEADAVTWLKSYRGKKFDLIIDDLFGEENGEPCRAVAADQSWCELLQRRLNPDGTLVMNFDTPSARRQCYYSDQSHSQWPLKRVLSTPLYSNSVGVWSRQKVDNPNAKFRANLRQFSALDERQKSCVLNYKMQTMR
ncbi:MAG: methyltransferase domain-containing protein [Cellvibrionaceae bacterium]